MSEVRIEGLAELSRTLKALPEKVRKNILRRAVGAGAAVIRDQAKINAPFKSGTLRRAAYIKYLYRNSNSNQVMFIASFRRGKKQQSVGKKGLNRDAYYAPFVEFGHKIVPRSKRVGSRYGKNVYEQTIRARRSAATATVPGQRMLTRAFTAKSMTALGAIISKIREGISKL